VTTATVRRRLGLGLRGLATVFAVVLATMMILLVVAVVSFRTEVGRDGELFE
jgi:hypothetical protein